MYVVRDHKRAMLGGRTGDASYVLAFSKRAMARAVVSDMQRRAVLEAHVSTLSGTSKRVQVHVRIAADSGINIPPVSTDAVDAKYMLGLPFVNGVGVIVVDMYESAGTSLQLQGTVAHPDPQYEPFWKDTLRRTAS